MKTRIIKISARNPNKKIIAEAAAIIRGGGLVAFPTETVYGLGANALDEAAVKKIFMAKSRPTDNPLIVHIADYKDLYKLAQGLPRYTVKLIRQFWPGPITLVARKKAVMSDLVTAKGSTVAVRIPSHPVAIALIKAAGVPIAAPSANRSGRPSATSAQDVLNDLKGRVDLILDAGQTRFGLESTVVDVTSSNPVILRPGAVSKEALENILKIPLQNKLRSSGLVLRSPGMKYRHYAPEAKVIIIPYGTPTEVTVQEQQFIDHFHRQGKRVGILATLRKTTRRPKADILYFAGATLHCVGKNLFRSLRQLDKEKVDVILAEGVPERDRGVAIMNRLRKAAVTK